MSFMITDYRLVWRNTYSWQRIYCPYIQINFNAFIVYDLMKMCRLSLLLSNLCHAMAMEPRIYFSLLGLFGKLSCTDEVFCAHVPYKINAKLLCAHKS